jgi:Flp pilus assembly protein TadD
VREGRLLLESDNGQLVLDFRRDDPRQVFDLELARARSRGANRTAQHNPKSARSEHGPGDVDGRLQLAEEMESSGDFDGALNVLVAASEAAPQSAELHARLGRLYMRLARLDAAEEHFTKALAADSRLCEVHMALADICERSGRMREALRHLSAAHRLTPR